MAGLVDYSSSSEDEPATPPTKKRKVSDQLGSKSDLPPLPAAFLDQYSSTVRTSAQDDPSLHGGRKRVTPHVQGNWPAHVYLEWYPNVSEAKLLADAVAAAQKARTTQKNGTATKHANDETVHSLLENELGVALPLHVSLSRPLALKTEQKDLFLAQLRGAIGDSNVQSFNVQPSNLAWHGNEVSTRAFLVLRLRRSADEELTRLLAASNGVANAFSQPLLYAGQDSKGKAKAAAGLGDKFHLSVAWALEVPGSKQQQDDGNARKKSVPNGKDGFPYELLGRLSEMMIAFSEVKVRIGQDVHAMPLKAARAYGVAIDEPA